MFAMFFHHVRIDCAVEAYLIALILQGRAETTRQYYASALNRLARHFRGRSLQAITINDLQGYLLGLAVSDSTLAVYTILIRRFLTWCVEQGYLKANPLAGYRVRLPPWNPVAPFTDDEIKRLLGAAANPMQRLVLLLLLDTGLRASELANLRRADIGKDQIKVWGKGGKARVVALNAAPKRALEEYLSTQEDSLLWPEGWGRKNLGNMLTALGQRAGVARVFPHRFRHTFSTRFLGQTGDALALKAILGHSSLTMTERYVAAMEGERALEVHRRTSLVA